MNDNFELRDLNNNLPGATNYENGKREDGSPNTKLGFSSDISTKEYKLRSLAGQFPKKTVTFDRCPPLFLGSKRNRSYPDLFSDNEGNLSEKCLGDIETSDSDSLTPSESEIFQSRLTDTFYDHSEIISKAEIKLADVLNQLQSLWLNLQDTDGISVASRASPSVGNKNLLQTISLISLVTDQLTIQYRNCVNSTSISDKLAAMHSTNELLEEELKNSKNKIKCLEAEIRYHSKEKTFLDNEVKELAYRIAATGTGSDKNAPKTPTAETNPSKTEIFYRNPHQQFQTSDSMSSEGVIHIPNGTVPYSQFPVQAKLICDTSHEEMLIVKRENEMNCIIKDFNEKFHSSSLQAQFQIYDEHLANWKRMLHATNDEKQQMLQDLVKIVHEHKAVLKERDHYEFILKLIIQEKSNEDFDIQCLLQTLISKLNEHREENGSAIQTALLEGAVQALQGQNVVQRDEINCLKYNLGETRLYTEAQIKELDECGRKMSALVEELDLKEMKLKTIHEEAQGKYDKIQELCNDANTGRTGLEKTVCEKENEIKGLFENIKVLKKANKKQQKKFQDLQKTNVALVKEIRESKGNMDHLAVIISQLRSGLKDQKSQWNERLRICAEEAAQNKEHCEWLKTQMDQLNQQLIDAHERVKHHEQDKVQLAQQLLLAEEERRVVDRKLQELRTALQGDTGLREALIERNEALQMEINRLRHAKLEGMEAIAAQRLMGREISPPMEMRTTDEFPSNAEHLPPTENCHGGSKLTTKKNCYTSSYRKPNDAPRAAVSLHNGGGK